MLELQGGDWRAALLPGQGAAFATLEHAGRPVLRPLDGQPPIGTKGGAFWMLPWTNRIDGGRFPVGERVYRLPVNETEAGNALHGLSRNAPWVVERAGGGHALLTQRLRHEPFDYAVRLELALAEEGFSLALQLENTGVEACPMGIGWHPWFARLPGSAPRFSATHRMVTDDRSLPLRAEPSAGLDGGSEWLGTDGHYAGWNGRAELRRDDLTVVMEAGGDWAGNLQFYAPAEYPVVCLEPVSHVPDVINRPALAPFGAMRVLAPGERLEGRLRLTIIG
ncbi:aldose epimerase family protein [Roseomonas marmotae]|uniref:Aldose epimerase n=1 Tax=Roseomonas marmotae TaxID=2768161 RepID=A0ABS3K9V1_9PROT|nr:aldose epimerase [Roseomonas marmotae]MBO1074244.1 aldose epimerase [Roseomonas marmotae]QTI79007.1 aldose epimerase [Roseomonas marmotae]